MTTTKTTEPERPLTDDEKQRMPLPGEMSPEEAKVKARQIAMQISARMQSKKAPS